MAENMTHVARAATACISLYATRCRAIQGVPPDQCGGEIWIYGTKRNEILLS